MYYGCLIFHFVLMAVFALGIAFLLLFIFWCLMWNSYQHFAVVLSLCVCVCVLRSIKTTRVSKFFEWLSRIDQIIIIIIITTTTMGHFSGSVTVAW